MNEKKKYTKPEMVIKKESNLSNQDNQTTYLSRSEVYEILDEYGIKIIDLPNFKTKNDVRMFCEIIKLSFKNEFKETLH